MTNFLIFFNHRWLINEYRVRFYLIKTSACFEAISSAIKRIRNCIKDAPRSFSNNLYTIVILHMEYPLLIIKNKLLIYAKMYNTFVFAKRNFSQKPFRTIAESLHKSMQVLAKGLNPFQQYYY